MDSTNDIHQLQVWDIHKNGILYLETYSWKLKNCESELGPLSIQFAVWSAEKNWYWPV